MLYLCVTNVNYPTLSLFYYHFLHQFDGDQCDFHNLFCYGCIMLKIITGE